MVSVICKLFVFVLCRHIVGNMCVMFKMTGTCVWYSTVSAVQVAYRASGVDVGNLSWQDLWETVDRTNPNREIAALRALKSRGIRREDDYQEVYCCWI